MDALRRNSAAAEETWMGWKKQKSSWNKPLKSYNRSSYETESILS